MRHTFEHRRRGFPGAAAFLVGSAGCALNGCTTLISPPNVVTDPVEVFVIDHGRTTSLVVPNGEVEVLRYAYGDWNYYALGRDDFLHGLVALLWPTQGALGRAEWEGPATAASVRARLTSVESVLTLQVERARVRDFVQRMEALFESQRDTQVENRSAGLHFVHHPRRYSYFWNSNHAVAAWLRELNCDTRGPALRANWRHMAAD